MRNRQKQLGFSYLEVIVAVAVLAVSLVPMLEALQTAFLGADIHAELAQTEQRLVASMETVLAEPFASLDAAAQAAGNETTPSSYSDPVATPDRVLVYLSRYDGDNADSDNLPFTGVDPGLIWVRVEAENTVHALEALTAL